MSLRQATPWLIAASLVPACSLVTSLDGLGSGGSGGAANSGGDGGGGSPGSGGFTASGSTTGGEGGDSSSAQGGAGGVVADCTEPRDPCGVCLYKNCTVTTCDCGRSPDCVELVDCLANCADDDCEQNCMSTNGDAISSAFLILDCAGINCPFECPFGEQLDDCTLCRFQSCDLAMNDCLESPECKGLLGCWDSCGADPTCQSVCESGVPATAADLGEVVRKCTEDNCALPCPP